MVRFLCLLFLLATIVLADDKDEGCVFKSETQGDFDFSQWKNGGQGYSFPYTADGSSYTMYLSVCEALSSSPCGNGATACQTWPGNGKKTIASNAPAFADLQGGGVAVTMSGGETASSGTCRTNSAILDMLCDETVVDDPKFTYKTVIISGGNCQYEFSSSHAWNCPVKSGGLSGGSLLLILGFVGFFLYCAVGAGWNYKRNEATGLDLVPNLNFWKSLPGLVKEGFRFTYYTVARKEDYMPL